MGGAHSTSTHFPFVLCRHSDFHKMDEVPRTHLAIIGDDQGRLKVAEQVQVPDLEEDMVLVKTKAVALNPVDIKMSGPLASPGAVAGHDYAGVVVAVGSKVWTAAKVKVGDRVCGAVMVSYGTDTTTVAFAKLWLIF